MALSVMGLLLFSDNNITIVIFGGLIAALCFFIAVVSFRSLRVMQASRSNPGLFDERASARFQKANAAGFTYMLNAALIGGAVYVIFDLPVPTALAFYGPAVCGVLGMLWVLSRDEE